MPRKKAEPEVLQEETVQPEITDIEELTPAERPGLAPQIEEPVQPYGEEESSAAEELPEPSEPEKKSFYDLDFRGTQFMLPSAAEASCAARSLASIPIP